MAALMLKKDHTGEGLYAARTYRPGDIVVEFEQVEWRSERDLFHPVLAKTAHSCEPNCRVSFRDRALVAIKPIIAGGQISFDYRSTEHQISHPFDCLCGSRRW